MRAGHLLLAFTASFILGTANIVPSEDADHAKPTLLPAAGRPDVTRTVHMADVILPRDLGLAPATTDGASGASVIDEAALEKRRGRSGGSRSRGGRTKKTKPRKKKTTPRKKKPTGKKPTGKKPTGTKKCTAAMKKAGKCGTTTKPTGTKTCTAAMKKAGKCGTTCTAAMKKAGKCGTTCTAAMKKAGKCGTTCTAAMKKAGKCGTTCTAAMKKAGKCQTQCTPAMEKAGKCKTNTCPKKVTSKAQAKKKSHARDFDPVEVFQPDTHLVSRAPTKGAQSGGSCEIPKCRAKIDHPGEDPCWEWVNHPRFVPCDKASKYTVDWFTHEAASRKPSADKCLFYTNGLSDIANAYAKRNGLTTIWNIWDGKLMPDKNKGNVITNPLRCIVGPDVGGSRNSVRQKYFETMSTAMATLCSGRVTFMDRNLKKDSYMRVKQAGIWGHQEFPTLRSGGKVSSIDAIGMFDSMDTRIRWPGWWQSEEPKLWPNPKHKPATLKEA